MDLLELLDRIYTVLDKLDEKHPSVKKVNKILSTAEKAILSGAKIIGIKVSDIKEIKNEPDRKEKDPLEDDGSQDEEGSKKEENVETTKEEEEEQEQLGYGKKIQIKSMFGKLPADKQNSFKEKMGDKFNSLGL